MANENALNAYLAEILRKAGIRTEVEYPFPIDKRSKRLADLACFEVEGYTIGIEAKHGWGVKLASNKKASIAQADELVVNEAIERKCHAAVALIYPDSYKTLDHLQGGKVKVAIRTPLDIRKQNKPEWNSRKVKDLPGLIKRIPSQLIGQPEELAKRAEIAVNQAFKMLHEEDEPSIQNKLGEAGEATNLKGLLVDLLTCFMFHSKLDDIRHQYIPKHFKKSNQPPTVPECIRSKDIIASFQTAYEKWLKVDYTDILEWNQRILDALPTEARSHDAVKRLAQTAREIQRAKGAHHHDLVGISFCNSITAAKQEGAMYTTLPAATLLTHLLFHKANIHKKSLEEVKSLRIVDFACGSGTLLIAAANYILQHEKTGNKKEVAKTLLEQMLYGFDINNRAIFQTATGLGMISPSVKFKRTQLRSMVYDIPKGEKEARLGSLEMLLGTADLFYNPPLGQKPDSQPEPVQCDNFHFAIMNPPFTRREVRHKQKNPKIEKALRKREEKIGQITGFELNGVSGNTNGFFGLTDKYLDKQGKAGIILPMSITCNQSAKRIRIWLPKHFHIQYIIVSYDPKRIFFSGNTNIGEMLLVLDRKKKTPTPTKVIKLFNNPVHESDAAQCAKAIYRGEDCDEWGVSDEIRPTDIAEGDWSATQFLSNELYRIAREIPNYWTSTFGNQASITIKGISRKTRSIRKCKPSEEDATPALWYHNTDYCKTLEVKPDRFICPSGTDPSIIKVFHKAKRLKLTERCDPQTVKNVACLTTVPSVGDAWSTAGIVQILNVDDETVEKAVAIILNSTLCKVGMLLSRSSKKPSYIQFPKDSWNRIFLPRLRDLELEQFCGLAKVYDERCKQPRKRLPEAHNCSVQRAIDDAVCKHTGFPEDICKKARHLLAQEPMVTGKRYKTNPEETNPELF